MIGFILGAEIIALVTFLVEESINSCRGLLGNVDSLATTSFLFGNSEIFWGFCSPIEGLYYCDRYCLIVSLKGWDWIRQIKRKNIEAKCDK